MATTWVKGAKGGPSHIGSEPQKGQAVNPISAGLDHRPFSDDEIKQAFDTFDLDNNRFVGAAEIQHILQMIGEEVTDEEIDEMIKLCDTDGDGQVTFDEFFKLMTNPPPPLPTPAPPRPAKARRQAQKSAAYAQQAISDGVAAAQAASMNRKSKRLTEEEQASLQAQKPDFRAMSVETLVKKLSGGIPKVKPSQIKKVYKRFQEIDEDGSGAIEYDEFITALEMENNAISRQMFRVFDMDGSGSIELKEFIVVLSRYTSAAKQEKLKFAFMMFDENSSGYIERDELLDMLNASFIIENLAQEELDEKANDIFDFLHLPRDGAICYEDFMKLAKARPGLIYPIEEKKFELGKDLSLSALMETEG